jgi:hypothetical protein
MFKKFFPENIAVYEIMWNEMVESERPKITVLCDKLITDSEESTRCVSVCDLETSRTRRSRVGLSCSMTGK